MESDAERDEEQRILCAEAILAETLALMTGHAQAAGDVQRRRIAQKVGLDLAGLAEHPALSPHFRLALSTLTTHWQVLEHQYTDFREREERPFAQAASSLLH